MLSRIRGTLRDEYIGAILIALVAMQVVSGAVGLVMMPIWFWASSHTPPTRNVFGSPEPPPLFNWNDLIGSAVHMALYALVVLALFRWLCLEKTPASESPDLMPDEDESDA